MGRAHNSVSITPLVPFEARRVSGMSAWDAWDDAGVSTSAAQAAAFYTEAVREGSVWTIQDEGGFPAPVGSEGHRAMPFWSLRTRAERTVATVPAYAGLEPVEIRLDVFRSRWLPGLEGDGLRVGLNWSGQRATGYDAAGPEVEENLAAATRYSRGEHAQGASTR